MAKHSDIIYNSLLAGFNSVVFSEAESLEHVVDFLVRRYLDSQAEAGKKITEKCLIAGIGALRTIELRMERKIDELREEAKKNKEAKKK